MHKRFADCKFQTLGQRHTNLLQCTGDELRFCSLSLYLIKKKEFFHKEKFFLATEQCGQLSGLSLVLVPYLRFRS